ncbi:MAG: hypothetical protein IPJ66_09045 [Bacteroidetes bacterium]|nr:hypothetical protein [Bacteroidota bacterium]
MGRFKIPKVTGKISFILLKMGILQTFRKTTEDSAPVVDEQGRLPKDIINFDISNN